MKKTIEIEGEIIEDVTGMVRQEFDYGPYEEGPTTEFYTVDGDKDDYTLSHHEGEYVRRIIIRLPYPKAPLCDHCIVRALYPNMNKCHWNEDFPKAKKCENFSEINKKRV